MEVFLRTGQVRVITGVSAARVETVASILGVRRMLVCRDGGGQTLARFDAGRVLAYRVGAVPPASVAVGARHCA